MALVRRLAGFALITWDAERLADFYETAFGFRRLNRQAPHGLDFERTMLAAGGGFCITLGLGQEIVSLIQFNSPGHPFSVKTISSDLIFQHFAIVTADIDQAYRRLQTIPGWTAISVGGPQALPASSGGVTAFKFRDPEGHPLELLAYPPGATPAYWRDRPVGDVCLGIDHSAIGVSDAARSVAFYEDLGLTVAARTLNQGPAQARLDGLSNPVVEVIAMTPPDPAPHVELLCYHPAARHQPALRSHDLAATRLILQAGQGGADPVQDPDGHRLILISGPSR